MEKLPVKIFQLPAPELRDNARANRSFLRLAVRFLAAERGVTQFLDIGTGIPTSPKGG